MKVTAISTDEVVTEEHQHEWVRRTPLTGTGEGIDNADGSVSFVFDLLEDETEEVCRHCWVKRN